MILTGGPGCSKTLSLNLLLRGLLGDGSTNELFKHFNFITRLYY